MTKVAPNRSWQHALILLTGTVVGVVIIASLYWAQVIFIPLALAMFFTFVLSPVVAVLHRRHVPRTPAVILVVLLAVLILTGTGWLIGSEIRGLVTELPQYTHIVKDKIKSIQEVGEDEGGGFSRMVREITGTWNAKPAEKTETRPAGLGQDKGPLIQRPPAVVVEPDSSPWLSRLPAVLSPVFELLAQGGLTLVLVVFMLLKREDLRNRLIWLVGHGRVTLTTKAFDDAGQRLSRYLLTQSFINTLYGVVFGLGLAVIGIPHAVLWGFLAGMLRYVPYLGTMVAMLLPLTVSLAMFPGWTEPLCVLGLIALLELVTYNVLEPWLFSQSLGVSEVVLLVAAAFWTFLWGPVGLVLSGPLTVCVVVLGKHVPHLNFLEVLLSDEQALDPDKSFYQRLAAKDQDEAAEIALAHAEKSSPEQVYDELLIPALTYLKRDREEEDLTEADEQFILRATEEIIEDVAEQQAASAAVAQENGDGDVPAAPGVKVRLLGCPGRDDGDRVALEMLKQLLDPAKWEVEILTPTALASEVVARVTDAKPTVVCIGGLPPGGLAHTRYLCKRLANLGDAVPGMKIVVGRWGLRGPSDRNEEKLRAAGADQVDTTLLETQQYLAALLPVLVEHQAAANGALPAQCVAG